MTATLPDYVRQLLAADEPGEAIRYLLESTKADELASLREQVILQSAQLQHWRKLRRDNTEDYDDLVRTRNKLNLALLALTNELPAGLPVPELPQPKEADQGISENKLKTRLLWWLVAVKLVVIGFTFTLWESGSFTNEQFTATVGLLVPIFAAYLTLMFKDRVDRRHALPHPDKYVTRGFQRTALGLVATYGIVLLVIINLRGPGVITFNQMNSLLALAESGLGVYVGQVIFALFKRGQD
ncbi:MAG: hypothetical protein KDC54_13815 [Lewinella sp.]|nr:hypothetical protein [Lewinella sp.]